jgi:hypothetical protein
MQELQYIVCVIAFSGPATAARYTLIAAARSRTFFPEARLPYERAGKKVLDLVTFAGVVWGFPDGGVAI